MLRTFLYLNSTYLDDYIGQLEGGVASEATEREQHSTSGELGTDIQISKAEGQRASTTESTVTRTDNPAARFDRLESIARDRPDDLWWADILNPATDLDRIAPGTLISGDCDIEVPLMSKTMTDGRLTQTLETMDTLASLAAMFSTDLSGMPKKSEITAMRKMYAGVDIPKVAVGYFDESEWKVIATIKSEFEREDIEGFGRVVGKVVSVMRAGTVKPLLTMKGMEFLNRQQRRDLERTKITDENRDQFIEGPAVVVDLLAIYR